jgi:hypothetical protein
MPCAFHWESVASAFLAVRSSQDAKRRVTALANTPATRLQTASVAITLDLAHPSNLFHMQAKSCPVRDEGQLVQGVGFY